MTKYLVTVHDGGGSMAEGIDPAWSAVVETEAEANELEKKIWDANGDDELFYDGLVIIHPIGDSVSVADALADIKAQLGDEEDEDEAELNAKVDGMMKGETAKLDGLFKDTYHKPARQTQIYQPPGTFTRHPVNDGYQPYQGEPSHIGLGGEGDPFDGLTDAEFEELTDAEFLAILHGDITVEQHKKNQEG